LRLQLRSWFATENFDGLKFVIRIAAILLVGLISLSAQPVNSSEGESFRYGIDGNNAVFLDRESAIRGSSLSLYIRGGTKATIVAELVDVFANSFGARRILALGSTPYTPQGMVRFRPEVAEYSPSAEFQVIDIPFRFKKSAALDGPVLGGLKISVFVKDSDQSDFRLESSIVGTFAFLPKASALDYDLAVAVEDFEVKSQSRDSFPFVFLPDIPRVFNNGSAVAQYKVKNTGDMFLEASSELVVEKVTFFGLGQREETYRRITEPVLLIQGQSFDVEDVITQREANRGTVESLGIGVYEISVIATGGFGAEGQVSSPIERHTFVIFPWKHLLGGLVLLALLLRPLRRLYSWMRDFSSAAKELMGRRRSSVDLLVPAKSQAQSKQVSSVAQESNTDSTVVSPEDSPNESVHGMTGWLADTLKGSKSSGILPIVKSEAQTYEDTEALEFSSESTKPNRKSEHVWVKNQRANFRKILQTIKTVFLNQNRIVLGRLKRLRKIASSKLLSRKSSPARSLLKIDILRKPQKSARVWQVPPAEKPLYPLWYQPPPKK
jgi:hypothetical protein